MSFSLQAGRPVVQGCQSAADTADAVGEMYSSEAEDAILVWNLVPVRLPYGWIVADAEAQSVELEDDDVFVRAKALLAG